MRLVLDTNVFVSFAINAASPVAQIVDAIMARHTVLHSPEMIAEVASTLARPKFAKYLSQDRVDRLVGAYVRIGESVPIVRAIVACRDPKDDKFLSAAIAGRADAIISGDADLLILHPFRGVEILKPAAVAERL